jgi:hypothetical protein
MFYTSLFMSFNDRVAPGSSDRTKSQRGFLNERHQCVAVTEVTKQTCHRHRSVLVCAIATSNQCVEHCTRVCPSVTPNEMCSFNVTQSQDGCCHTCSEFRLLSLIGAVLTTPGTATMLRGWMTEVFRFDSRRGHFPLL